MNTYGTPDDDRAEARAAQHARQIGDYSFDPAAEEIAASRALTPDPELEEFEAARAAGRLVSQPEPEPAIEAPEIGAPEIEPW